MLMAMALMKRFLPKLKLTRGRGCGSRRNLLILCSAQDNCVYLSGCLSVCRRVPVRHLHIPFFATRHKNQGEKLRPAMDMVSVSGAKSECLKEVYIPPLWREQPQQVVSDTPGIGTWPRLPS